eukprot:m.478919 g.478919  ORF g.478919 m.478919 type:complete len:57 (-) comp47903_c0_seq1:79-249(-)
MVSFSRYILVPLPMTIGTSVECKILNPSHFDASALTVVSWFCGVGRVTDMCLLILL